MRFTSWADLGFSSSEEAEQAAYEQHDMQLPVEAQPTFDTDGAWI